MDEDHSALGTNPPAQDSVDEEVFAELFTLLGNGRADGLIHACELFLTGVPTHLANARSALAEARLDDAGGVAHSLRGTAGAFGARRLSSLAERLELSCRQGDAATAEDLLFEMRLEYSSFRPVLTARLAALTALPGGPT